MHQYFLGLKPIKIHLLPHPLVKVIGLLFISICNFTDRNLKFLSYNVKVIIKSIRTCVFLCELLTLSNKK